MSTAEKLPEAAHVVDYDATPTGVPECVDDCPGCADDALSPTLRRLRDAILAEPAMTSAEALLDASELLADHARELAAAQETRAREIGRDMRKRGDRSRVAYCGGMDNVLKGLYRYADDLDAAAVDGEA